ncbi:hypothetical protein [Compostimonas suwonensis]|uniref:Uncharacterized protein n=1 Tax=Compostimonas suwonensis TaxID=1048394 RepID=A0A2M9BWC8_9MICO|nr:hypothetical protein [Compostimonas suwonensis]PJJ62252.1 hypothetical protein CLV54_2049 [Compostimonas suwonensis]
MAVRRTRLTLTLALAGALVIAPLLSGCIGNPLEGGIEQVIKDQTGEDVDLNIDGGVPEGFPAEVVLIDGTASGLGSTVEGKQGWVVTVEAANALDAAKEKLVAAGFTVDNDLSTDGGGIVQLSNGTYTVGLLGSADGVVYTVTPQ